MKSGSCIILIDGIEVGQVEYRYNDTGRGQLWMEPEILFDAFHSNSVALRLAGEDCSVIIESATPGEAAPFAFSEWRKVGR